uniref:Uncharacterized protein n=1 Tax=Oryza nivara TaxID=4536 RepID=A0A0E0J8T8_ORYNI
MASCYYKTRQGIIKQEEFTLSVDDKSKLPTDYSNAPIPTYKVAQIYVDQTGSNDRSNWGVIPVRP